MVNRKKLLAVIISTFMVGLVGFGVYQYQDKKKYVTYMSSELSTSFLDLAISLEEINRIIADAEEREQWSVRDRQAMLEEYKNLDFAWGNILSIARAEDPELFQGNGNRLHNLPNVPIEYLKKLPKDQVFWSVETEKQLKYLSNINDLWLEDLSKVSVMEDKLSGFALSPPKESYQPFVKRERWKQYLSSINKEEEVQKYDGDR